MIYDCIIIGDGPAGLSAAMQLSRLNRRVVVVGKADGRSAGKQVVRNVPLWPHLEAELLRQWMERELPNGAESCWGEVDEICKHDAGFFVLKGFGLVLGIVGGAYTKSVILATGVRDNFPYWPGDEWRKHLGIRVFHCAHCDGKEAKDKKILVLGPGAEAEGDKLLHGFGAASVTVSYGSKAAFYGGFGKMLLCDIEYDQVWFTDEPTPRSKLARALGVKCDEKGYIQVDKEQATNIPGVYAAGDVTKPFHHLVATAVHEGLTAAISVDDYLRGKNG